MVRLFFDEYSFKRVSFGIDLSVIRLPGFPWDALLVLSAKKHKSLFNDYSIAQNPGAAECLASGASELAMLSDCAGEDVVNDVKTNADEFSLSGVATQLDGKSMLLIVGQYDQTLPPNVFHIPLKKSLGLQPDIDLPSSVPSAEYQI